MLHTSTQRLVSGNGTTYAVVNGYFILDLGYNIKMDTVDIWWYSVDMSHVSLYKLGALTYTVTKLFPIKIGEFLGKVWNYQLLKNDATVWSSFLQHGDPISEIVV